MARKYVYLIRHGKTKENEEKRYAGKRTDTALSERGIEETQRKRPDILSRIGAGPERIISAHMKRAKQTAALLFPDRQDIEVCEMTETDFGEFEGKNYEELNGNGAYQKWIESNGTLPFPGGDNRKEYAERTLKIFYGLLGNRDVDESIVLVCHGGNIMSIMTELAGGDLYDHMCRNLGGYSLELETDDEGIHIISYNKLDCVSDP